MSLNAPARLHKVNYKLIERLYPFVDETGGTLRRSSHRRGRLEQTWARAEFFVAQRACLMNIQETPDYPSQNVSQSLILHCLKN